MLRSESRKLAPMLLHVTSRERNRDVVAKHRESGK